MIDGKWLTVQEAQEYLSVSGGYIRRLLGNGALVGEKVGGNWVISIDVLDVIKPTIGRRSNRPRPSEKAKGRRR